MNDTLIFVLSAVLVILIGAVVRGKSSAKTHATTLSRGKFTGVFITIAIAGLFGVGLLIEKLNFPSGLQTVSSNAGFVPGSELKTVALSPKVRSVASVSTSTTPTDNMRKAVLISISGPAPLYESNESVVDKDHEGRALRVSGTVQSIDQDVFDNTIVMLHSGNQFSNGHASIDARYKNMTVGLKKGEKITLLCESGAVVVGSLILRHCAPT